MAEGKSFVNFWSLLPWDVGVHICLDGFIEEEESSIPSSLSGWLCEASSFRSYNPGIPLLGGRPTGEATAFKPDWLPRDSTRWSDPAALLLCPYGSFPTPKSSNKWEQDWLRGGPRHPRSLRSRWHLGKTVVSTGRFLPLKGVPTLNQGH